MWLKKYFVYNSSSPSPQGDGRRFALRNSLCCSRLFPLLWRGFRFFLPFLRRGLGVGFLLISLSAQSQWTLQACLDRAKTTNYTIRQKEIIARQAKITLQMAQAQRLPLLSASLGQNVSFGLSPSYTGTYLQNNSSVSIFSASLSVPLFDGFRTMNTVKSNRLEVKASEADTKQAVKNVEINVIAGYLQILMSKELVHAAQEQVQSSGEQIVRIQQLIEAGKLSKPDIYEGEAQLAKDSATLVQANNDLKLARISLAQLLQLDDVTNFDASPNPSEGGGQESAITENGESGRFFSPPLEGLGEAEKGWGGALIQHNPGIQALQYRVNKSIANIAIARADYFPTVSLSAGYYNNYYHYYNLLPGMTNETFSNQLHQNQQQIIALSIQIPIFNRFDTQHRVKLAKWDVEQQKIALESQKQELYKTIQQTACKIIADKATCTALTKEVESLKIDFQYAQEKFNVGKISIFELNTKRTALSKAISDQLNAKYQYLFGYQMLKVYLEEI